MITGSHLCKHLRHHQLFVVFACNVKRFAFAVLVFFMFPSRPVDRLTKVFLGTFYHSLPRKVWPRPDLFHCLNLLFKTFVVHDMSCALQKIVMVEVSGHIKSRISGICGKIIIFAGMFISPPPQCLWPPNLTLMTLSPITTKLGRVVNYLHGVLLMTSHDPLVMCASEITWQTNNILSITVPIATKRRMVADL